MSYIIRKFQDSDLKDTVKIWNQVVNEGNAFPQNEPLDNISGKSFFTSQTYTGIAADDATGEIYGLYILHPNNVGRCGHICNASFAVKDSMRGMNIGKSLVVDCKMQAKNNHFKIMQFNAVVKSNTSAINLYEQLGFVKIGEIPGGFMMKSGKYEDIVLFYCTL